MERWELENLQQQFRSDLADVAWTLLARLLPTGIAEEIDQKNPRTGTSTKKKLATPSLGLENRRICNPLTELICYYLKNNPQISTKYSP
jgi:hypothetical protein